ncbi:MAG: hypothetical protein AcusKO_19750 [Acuticoccus sp.]
MDQQSLDGASSPSSEAGVPASTLRWTLRQATTGEHEALDQRFATMSDGSPDSYRAFIRMNHACHVVIEEWLDRILPAEVKALRERYDAHLTDDMRTLGLAHLPPQPFPVEGVSLSEAAGVVYVIDGSRLGTRLIARSPAARQEGASAYVSAASAPGDVFAAFNALCGMIDEAEIPASVEAARKTFILFTRASDHVCDT